MMHTYFTASNQTVLASLSSPRNAVSRQHIGYQYSVSSPRSRFYDPRFEDPQPHFLDYCSLCTTRLANKDIFMYRGDIPFCSDECRQEQIEMDEAKEKKMNLSSALRKKEHKRPSLPTKGHQYSFRAGTVNAAA